MCSKTKGIIKNNTDPPKRKAIFIDRDGVINYNRNDYVKSWAEFKFIPGAKEAIKRINDSNLLLIIITNQSPIGRGIFKRETLDYIHKSMLNELNDAGAHIDAIYYCPHHPDDNCDCRKPKPGLILRAAKDFNIDLARSWMVGDSDSDLEAGAAAGCKTLKVTLKKPLIKVIDQLLG
ncbi:D-glycero-beta-D-manno-heptose 1,7-bisphosphate 7-phosphatase [[Eubacterium] cellulosolvens]